jgi:type I restriction enzyme, S subunit
MTALGNAPAHWRRTTIGEIAEVRLGRQRSPKNHAGDHMQPYLRAANVNWYRLRPDDIQTMNFTADEMETYTLWKDDILIVEGSGSATEVGKCALVPHEFSGHAFQNTLIRVRANPDVDPRWLMYRINADAELGGFLALARGSGIFHLGSTRTAKWPVALPPMAEQHATVEIIERLLSLVEAATEDTARGLARSQILRRSALADAFRRFRPQGEAAPTSHLEALEAAWRARRPRTGRGADRAPEPMDTEGAAGWSWPVASLDALNDPSRPICYGILKPRVGRLGEVPYVEVRDLRELPLREERMNRTSLEMDAEFSRSRLSGGDVVVAVRGSYDIAAVVPPELDGANVSRDVARVAPLPGVDPEYLAHYITSNHSQRYFRRVARGVAVTGVNIGSLRRLPVPVPPLATQMEIAEHIAIEMIRVEHFVRALESTQRRATSLRRSILKAAFEGKLSVAANDARATDELLEAFA